MTDAKSRVKGVVRDSYAEIATATEDQSGSACAPASSCCGTGPTDRTVAEVAATLGYTEQELQELPGAANLGLGCGNPHALAALREGEVVVDLGSGGGIDCFIAARKVGPSGRVIGVDMTPEMLEKARSAVADSGCSNVEFRLGEIEHLPVADGSVDVILSNCVINLSPDKQRVFDEAFRVLKPGGRLAISDVVATAPLPDEIRNDDALLSGCVAGAATIEELEGWLLASGFRDVTIEPWAESRDFIRDWAPGRSIEDYVVSARISAVKP